LQEQSAARIFLAALQFVKKPRRVCRPQAANISNHFSPRHVRGEKYLSGCQCGICAPMAHKLCAQQTWGPLSEKTGGFFDSIKRRKDFPCGAFLEDLWLVIWGRTEYDTNGESISPCEEK